MNNNKVTIITVFNKKKKQTKMNFQKKINQMKLIILNSKKMEIKSN